MSRPGRGVAGAAAVLLVAAAGASCSNGGGGAASGRSPTATTSDPGEPQIVPPSLGSPSNLPSLPACQFPKKIPMPEWFPEDLPLPKGSYATQDLGESQGVNRGVFVVPGSLADFARFVLDAWPAAGWELGRGDSEEDEIEDEFSKVPAAGHFKARAVPCSPGYSTTVFLYSPTALASPTPSA